MRPVAAREDDGVQSAPERLADLIEHEIAQQHLSAGDRFGLRTALIERYGVSPGTMNEALRILRERRVVTVRPGVRGGVFVAQVPPQIRLGVIDLWFRDHQMDPGELFEARSRLEDTLAVVAAERATPEDARAIAWALEGLRDARSDPLSYVEANIRFHAAIVRAARAPVLAQMYDVVVTTFRALLVRAEYVGPDAMAVVDRNVEVHAAMMRAIVEGDQRELSHALADHRIDLVRVPRSDRGPRPGSAAQRG